MIGALVSSVEPNQTVLVEGLWSWCMFLSQVTGHSVWGGNSNFWSFSLPFEMESADEGIRKIFDVLGPSGFLKPYYTQKDQKCIQFWPF